MASKKPRNADDFAALLTDVKDFSGRNIRRKLAFHRDHPDLGDIVQEPLAPLPASAETRRSDQKSAPNSKVPQPAAQLPGSILWVIPWAHHVFLMDQLFDLATRRRSKERTIRANLEDIGYGE